MDPSRICRRKDIKCTEFHSINNKFKRICQHECLGSFNNTCGQNYCALDQISCLTLKAYNSDLIRKIIGPTTYKSKMKNNNLQKIKDCPSISYEWNFKHVCIRKRDCYLKYKLPFMNKIFSSFSIKERKTFKCFCDQNHSYQCMNKYCVTNKQTCDALVLNLSFNPSIYKNFSMCNNLRNIL